MPKSSRQRSKQQPKKPDEEDTKWWDIKDILQERYRGGKIEYLIDWEPDKATGERYAPTWAPSKDVTSKAIFDWTRKKNAQAEEGSTSESEQESGAQRDQEDTEEEGASLGAPPTESLDSSQPVQAPTRRKRTHHQRSAELSEESRLDDSEDDEPNPPKRHCSEALSSLSSGSEIDTDAASDILPDATTTFCVEIPSKLGRDTSEYISISASQGSTSLSSQAVSALEEEDSQVLLTENFSQRTIPDSQDSAFNSQESYLAAVQAGLVSTNRPRISADLEIPDSQKLSSLGDSRSKTSEYQAQLIDTPSSEQSSQTRLRQRAFEPGLLESSQEAREDQELPGHISLSHNRPERPEGPVVPCTFPIVPERQPSTGRPRSESQDSASLAAQAAAQLVQEQESIPATFSEASIPSHQVDDLPPENSADHSSHYSTVANNHRESQSSGTPVFLTQPAFDFDVSSSQAPISQKERSTAVSGASEQQTSQTADQNERGPEELVTISDSQGGSLDTQHAQIVPPLPNISVSQIGSTSSIAEEELVPDTVRRPRQRRHSVVSLGSTSVASSRRGPSSRSSNRFLASSQQDGQGESFRTCVERQSLPPTNNEPTAEVRRDRPSSLPPTMDASTSGEPLSAIEELMRLQEAALNGTLTQSALPSPTTGDLDHLRVDGGSITEENEGHAFSASMDNPSIHINSQPPIASDWNLAGAVSSSTEMPVLSSAPVRPVTETPVHEPPQTASMGDIFPGNLMPPETTDQLPTTISPSDISRSIEPDDGLAALHQQDDQPLDILPAEDTATAKSTASSPDVEEHYQSGPPTSVDQSEYLVTVSFPAHIRPLYQTTMASYKREMEQFTQHLRNGEVPDQSLVDTIGKLLGTLRDICDLPASLDGSSIDALSAEDLKKHAMGTNSKYFFVGQFLERLQTSHRKILIIVRDINIMGYLEAVLGTGDMAYSLKGLHELETQEEHSLHIVLLHTEQNLVDDLSDFDVVIGFDRGIMQTDILSRWAQMNGKKPMLIRLMTTYSIEHLELMLPDDSDEMERMNALLIAMFQSRSLIANDEQGEMIDGLAAVFASQAIDPDPSFGWEPEPIPSSVLDVYSSTQPLSQMPPSAEELTTRKRKADDVSQETTKRVRLSPSPGRNTGSIDDSVHGHLNPNPSHLQVRTTQDHLDSLTTKVSELEHQLSEKTSLEANLRKHITNLSKRVKSHDKTINMIQERHMAALRERSIFEAQRDEAKENEEKAWEKSRSWQEKAEALEEELKKKSATLDEALLNAGTVATETFKQKMEELERSQAKVAELEKKLESREGELGYARDAYQTANQANSELSRENRELKTQLSELQKQAAGSLAQVQVVNANEQAREMARQIAETQAITRDREKELARVEKELRTLKNGRRETRQQSVPRSPRLGMMSPRTGRAAGTGSASRGTSPTPYESAGGTPVPGIQFFTAPANGRWGHLRD